MNTHSCCPSCGDDCQGSNKLDRGKFIKVLGGTTLSVAALSGLTWKALAANPFEEFVKPQSAQRKDENHRVIFLCGPLVNLCVPCLPAGRSMVKILFQHLLRVKKSIIL
jgi:hypothetical protein